MTIPSRLLPPDLAAKAARLQQLGFLLARETRVLRSEASAQGYHFPDEIWLLCNSLEDSSDNLACYLRAENYSRRSSFIPTTPVPDPAQD